MLYWLLRGIASIGLRWYYRSIEVEGRERFPAAGPVILVANHWNALVDALVIACALPRPVRLTAKATLLANPVTRLIVRSVGIIPLRRVSDEVSAGDTPIVESRNANSFEAMLDALTAEEVMLIFPEGKSHSEPELAPLKTGCARLALMAQAERGIQSLPIVPVGLTFEGKGRPRSRVVMRVGVPIVAPAHDDFSPDAVRALTARVDQALRDITLNFASRNDSERVLELSSVLTKVLDRVRPLEAPDPPMADAVRMAQRLEAARQALPQASAETLSAVNVFLERVDVFRLRLRASKIPANDLWMPITLLAGSWFALREGVIALATLPIVVWGRLNHWIPLSLARWIGRVTSENPDEPAMHTLVSGLIFVLAFYLLLAFAIARIAGFWWALLYLVSLPPAASLDFWVSERLRRGIERAHAYLMLRRDPELRLALRHDASEIRSEARRLGTLLG